MEDGKKHREPEHDAGSTVWDRISELSSVGAIQGEPDFNKVGRMHEVSEMAGWAKEGGHESMQGVGLMAVGEVDATQELEAESATEGGPLLLADGESCFDDRHNTGIMSMSIDRNQETFDWCSYL